jgi:predicted dienelactone hydrolase
MSEYTLVLLQTQQEYATEGRNLRHGLENYYPSFQKNGVRVYSFRKEGKPLLTLSAQLAGYTDHIVGKHNRPPTPEEFELLAPFLAELGIENRYDPTTLH